MYVIIWEYEVKADHVTEFEGIYGPEGAWAQLFKKHPGYLGSELLRDSDQSQRYITIDRWTSSEAYNSFQAKWQDEYNELDTRCESFMDSESFLGTLSLVGPGG